ncbi:hypothetical protein ACO0LL_07585 [Undibacterium sp. TC4M20W]|uniref:hypothetical protein n=1 Tax=unclassified Undibacterium TaxID=2630295 RepID=UPI003BF23CC0
MEHPVYVEKQWMKLLWIILPVSTVLLLAVQMIYLGPGMPGIKLALPLVSLLLLVLLGALTVSVDASYLRWHFGLIGFPSWKIALSDIAYVEATTTSMMEGYGIRFTSKGMLYNATGNTAILVVLRNGKALRLGTQDPQRLLSYITPRLNAS